MTYNNYRCIVTFTEKVSALNKEAAIKQIEKMSIEKLGDEFVTLKIECVELPRNKEEEARKFVKEGYFVRNGSY